MRHLLTAALGSPVSKGIDLKFQRQAISVIPYCFEAEKQNKIQSPTQWKAHRTEFKIFNCQSAIYKEKMMQKVTGLLRFYLVTTSDDGQLKHKSI